MQGIILAICAGVFIALQNVFNATIGTHVSTWSTAMLTQAVGATGAFIIYLIVKGDSFSNLKLVKPIYLLGGSFGALVVATSIMAVTIVGAGISNAVLLIAQLLAVVLIETFGWFDMKKQPLAKKHVIGLTVMMIGALFIIL